MSNRRTGRLVKAPIFFGGIPSWKPNYSKQPPQMLLHKGITLSEYGSEGFRVRLRRLSEYGFLAYFVERPTWETRGLWEGVVPGTSAQSFVLCFSVFWGDFLLQISQKFLSEIAPPMQAFSGKPPREKPFCKTQLLLVHNGIYTVRLFITTLPPICIAIVWQYSS